MPKKFFICTAIAFSMVACSPRHNSSEIALSSARLVDSFAEGKVLYEQNCFICHGALSTTAVRGKGADQINQQISQNPAMGHLMSLTDAEISLIAQALGVAPAVTSSELAFQSGSVVPARSLAGAQFRISAKFTTQKSYSQLSVRLVLKSPSGAVVESKIFENNSASSTSPLIVEHLYSTTESASPGQYKVTLEVLNGAGPVVPVIEANAFFLYAPIRIIAGSPSNFTDSAGRVWNKDSGFTGGQVLDPFPPITAVAGTADSYIYNGLRWGEFNYRFAVPAGAKYKVYLYFAENYVVASGQRVFGVRINDTAVLQNFDIFSETGGMWRALVKNYAVQPADDFIQIDFVRGPVQEPKIGAIAIVGDQL